MGLLDFGIESEISTYSEYRLSNRRRLVKAILLIGFPLIAVFLAADLFVGGGNTTAYVTFGLAVIFTALLLVPYHLVFCHKKQEKVVSVQLSVFSN